MARTQISYTNSTKSDPSEVKEKLVMRLLIKMQKQFGDDPETTSIISSVIREKIQPNK